MTFPTVVDQVATSNITNGVYTMPTFSPGQLLLANTGSLTAPSSASSVNGAWTLLGSDNIGSTTFQRLWGKIAEAGDTFSLSGGFGMGGFITSIDGWSGVLADIGYAGAATGTIDPPSLTMPSALDYLWLAGGSNFSNNITAAPTNYTNLATATFNTGGDHKFALARRNLNASSENPGTFSGTANTAGGWTIAIKPFIPGSPPMDARRRRNARLVR